jgi:hypothetical protein
VSSRRVSRATVTCVSMPQSHHRKRPAQAIGERAKPSVLRCGCGVSPVSMRIPALAIRLRWAALVPAAFLTACVATSSPRIRACAAGGDSAVSAGMLRILPSTVPGVEIDSAWWRTGAGTVDIGAVEQLSYFSRLRASRDVRRNELAIVYEPHDSAMVLDADVATALYGRAYIDSRDRRYADLHAGETTTTARVIQLGGGVRVGEWSAVPYCPRAVQLVARGELPFVLMPRLTSDSTRLAASRSAEARRSSLVVVKDTLLRAGWEGGSTPAWAAINVADTALADMIVALVVVGRAPTRDTSAHAVGVAVEDTIEYHVGPVAARGRAGFVGGNLRYPEGVVERIAYPAASIIGRTIPRLGEMGRVSDARAVARERAWDSSFEQVRAADALWTDSLQYFAQRGREVTPGVHEYQLTLVIRWQNPMPAPLYLPRCREGGAPAYAIVRNATSEERTAYTPASSCPDGIRPLRIDPGSARVDTLRLQIRHADRPDWEVRDGPRAEGMFRVTVDVLTCDDGTPACRPPRLDRLSRSRPFQVRLGRTM